MESGPSTIALRARGTPAAQSVRRIVGMLVKVVTVGALMSAVGDPSVGSVLVLGAGTLAYLLASFGSETA